MSETKKLGSAIAAEPIGTMALLATVVGSGIVGSQLAAGNSAIALLANALATGAMLYVLISFLGAISGAHLDPIASLVLARQGQLAKSWLLPFWAAQITGAILGVLLAHALFDLALWQPGTQ